MYGVYFDDGRETHSYYYYKMENAIKKYGEILEEFKKEDIKRIWERHVDLINWVWWLKIKKIEPLDVVLL